MAYHQTPENYSQNVTREETNVEVVMVPHPGQGHLNQLLHLARIVSSYNISVHFVGTTTHIRQAKLRIHGWDPLTNSNIHFHEFHLPPFENPLPDPNAPTKFPLHLIPAFVSMYGLREPVRTLMTKLSNTTRRVIVIHDSLMFSIVQDVLSIPNSESYCFHSISAFATFSFHCQDGKPVVQTYNGEPIESIPSLDSCVPPELLASKYLKDCEKCNSGNLFNTCRAIEGQFLNFFAKEKLSGTNKQWAIGPFNPLERLDDQEKNTGTRHKCLEWLDKQCPKSVIYVAFGTTTSLSDEEVEEIATGLERSGQNFIWILNDADRGDIFAGDERRVPLPEGFEDRVARRGLVLRDWAPQMEILAHPSTGGFMSHCGWNSCMESISFGVPIAAWPMHSDQPTNTILITKILKIGLVVKDWEHRDELVKSDKIEQTVRKLMASAEGDEMRKRAAELSNAIKRSMNEGGATSKEMDALLLISQDRLICCEAYTEFSLGMNCLSS